MRNAVVDSASGAVKRHGRTDFSVANDFDALIETQVALNEGTIPPDGVPLDQIEVVNGNFAVMSDIRRLPARKSARKLGVDIRTQTLIAEGFTHASKIFSLSLAAQINWTNAGLNPTALIYPYRVSTKDDLDFHDFADATEMQIAYGVALTIKANHLTAGADLKKDINDATTQAALDAVVDTR